MDGEGRLGPAGYRLLRLRARNICYLPGGARLERAPSSTRIVPHQAPVSVWEPCRPCAKNKNGARSAVSRWISDLRRH
jgi:hypothetical protein